MKIKKIRVIKKKDLETAKSSKENVKTAKTDTARNVVANVSSWVSDFKNRKQDETKTAIETLLANRPQSASS
ncbi:MAG: hypothetical protein HKN33_01845 [Pyrinomonadaceae bacterium]|nr:hypothetical protein [Pyrinomonadaceae bacterium]